MEFVIFFRGLPVELRQRDPGDLFGDGIDGQGMGFVGMILGIADVLPDPALVDFQRGKPRLVVHLAAARHPVSQIDIGQLRRARDLDLAEQVRDATLRLYAFAAAHAAERGIILADTKFEFGTDADGRLYVMDEMLTPDSSRYWPADEYRVGTSPPSYDKQIVRDWLETQDWDKTPPGPRLPAGVIERTRARYADALQKLAGIRID